MQTQLPLLFVALLLLLASAPPALAATRYVDASASGAADGTSWTDAFPTLQDALAAAVSGDEIWIAGGVYYPDEGAGQVGDDRASTFQLIDGVTLYGGFAGNESAAADRRPEFHPVVLSGDLEQNDLDADLDSITEEPADILGNNAYHVVTASGNAATAVLRDVVITAGDANGAGGLSHGGGLYALAGSPTIEHCRFSGNNCDGRGGAVHFDNASPALTNCLFSGNGALNRGGAAGTLNGAAPVFTNCVFLGNLSQRGGACNFNDSTPSLVNCSLSGNWGTINGGGVQGAVNSVVTITNCVTWNNRAAGSTATTGASINLISGATAVYNYSLLDNLNLTATGTGNFDGTLPANNPLFADPPDPSLAPSPLGDLRLATTSPLLDAGDNTANSTPDPDGRPRLLDGDHDTIADIDLGAYELPRVLHVDANAAGLADGTSWSDAYPTLRAALNVDADDDEIWVAQGVYYPDEGPGATNNSPSQFFSVNVASALYGGFTGVELHRGARDVAANPTILSGDITQNDLDPDGNDIAESFADIQPSNSTTIISFRTGARILDGFTITAAYDTALHTSIGVDGGDVVNCLFTGNRSFSGDGAAAYLDRTVHFSRCVFEGGLAAGNGGAIYIDMNESPSFTDCTIRNNRATRGGGVFVEEASPLFVNVLFENNIAFNDDGGGLYNNNLSDTLLVNCVLRGNLAENGGGLFNHTSQLDAINCTFTGNEVDGFSPNGGAIANRGTGGFGGVDGDIDLFNTIIWENFDEGDSTTAGASVHNGSNSSTSYSHCLVENWNPLGPGNLNGNDPANDPLLDPSTSVPDPASPVINIGLDASFPSTVLPLDFDGDPRVHGAAVDLGAFELNGPAVIALPPSFQYAPNSPDQNDILDLATLFEGTAVSFALDSFSPAGVVTPVVAGSQLSINAFQADAIGVVTVTVSASDGVGSTLLDILVQVSQNPLYVDHAAAGAATGLSWTDAFANPQDALRRFIGAPFPVEIWTAQGTYYPDEGLDQVGDDTASSFLLSTNIALYGGFQSGATALAQRDPASFPVILSGDLNQAGTIRAKTVATLADDATLDSLTVTGASNPGGSGGGLVVSGDASVNACSILENAATDGAGAFIDGASPAFTNCLFAGNTATQSGGGASGTNGGAATFTNCEFKGNTAANGGGMALDNHAATLTNATFQGNRSSGNGGALSVGFDVVSLRNTVIWNNEAQGTTASQGASIAGGFTPSFQHCLVEHWNLTTGGTGNLDGTHPANAPAFALPVAPSAAPDTTADLRLAGNSPLIEAGDNALNATPVDIHGTARIFDGDGDSTATIDVGASEYKGPLIVNPTAPLKLPPGAPDQIDVIDVSKIFDPSAGSFAIEHVQNPLFTANLAGVELSLTSIQSTPGVSLITVSAQNGDGISFYQIVVAILFDPLYVDQSVGASGDGSSWAAALKTLGEALDYSDTFAGQPLTLDVWIADGTYYPDEGPGRVDDDRASTFSLRNRLNLYGGFRGDELTFAQRVPGAYHTFLSGDLAQDDGGGPPAGANAYHVVTGDSFGALVLVDGFTILDGLSDGPSPDDRGAGSRLETGILTFADVTWTGNVASGFGGGLWKSLYGTAQVAVSNCSFTGNSAAEGGALILPDGTVTATTFTQNAATTMGGAVSGRLTCENCVFLSNTAPLGGAAYLENNETATFTNCRFSGNTGDALYNNEANATVVNSLFSGNTPRGLRQRAGDTTVINSTFSGNATDAILAFGYSTGIIIPTIHEATLDLVNTLCWNGRGPGFPDAAVTEHSYATVNYDHCLVQGADLTGTGTGNLDGTDPGSDPLLVAPPDPASAPSTAGDLRLLVASPALDAGDNAANAEPLDLAGAPRIANAVIDLGAYEGGALATFALIHPGLDPDADANDNGLSNYHDYAAGFEPAAPTDPSAFPSTFVDPAGDRFFVFTYRTNAADVFASFDKSTDLSAWAPMLLAVDYVVDANAPLAPGRGELTLEILFDPAIDPRYYWRRVFSTTP